MTVSFCGALERSRIECVNAYAAGVLIPRRSVFENDYFLFFLFFLSPDLFPRTLHYLLRWQIPSIRDRMLIIVKLISYMESREYVKVSTGKSKGLCEIAI